VRPRFLTLIAAVAVLAGAAPRAAAFDPVPGNPADRLAELPIEPFRYDHARRCLNRAQPGTRALEAWLGAHAGGVSWGIVRCARLSGDNYSLHAEGRALDWHLDAARPADKREAERVIALLLAPDRLGNPAALARRMGVQEIIWSCRSWFSGSDRLQPYSACYDPRGRRRRRVDRTLAHRDHVHFGLNWPAARMRTSFWTPAP
jgi:hypothetical protein